MDWFDLLAIQEILKSLPNTTVQEHQFFGAQLSLESNSPKNLEEGKNLFW